MPIKDSSNTYPFKKTVHSKYNIMHNMLTSNYIDFKLYKALFVNPGILIANKSLNKFDL